MDAIATPLLALAPGATVAAVPTAVLLAIRPPRANDTRLRALATWVLVAAALAGLVTGLVWWLQVLIRIGIAHDDVRTWPSAFAPTVLCMVALGGVLYQLLLLGLGRARGAEERGAGPSAAPTSGPS